MLYHLKHRSVVALAAAVTVIGVFTGCSSDVDAETPNLPEVQEPIATELQDLGDAITDQLRQYKDDLEGWIDEQAPVGQQIDQLTERSKELYCDADDSEAADAVKDAVIQLRDEIAQDNPGVKLPPIDDLSPESCA